MVGDRDVFVAAVASPLLLGFPTPSRLIAHARPLGLTAARVTTEEMFANLLLPLCFARALLGRHNRRELEGRGERTVRGRKFERAKAIKLGLF